MLFRRCNVDQLRQALAVANVEYKDNLCLADSKTQGSAVRARLSVFSSKEYGARTSASGRHGPFASWEAHRDFLRALFEINPAAMVVTSMAKYTAENFEDVYPATGNKNIGSMMCPRTMPECTVQPEHKIQFGTLTSAGKLVDVRLIKQSDITRCPHYILVPEHYRNDGSCRCNDPKAKVMQEWGYVWSKEHTKWESGHEAH